MCIKIIIYLLVFLNFLLNLCVCMQHCVSVEVSGQVASVGFLLPWYESLGSNVGPQACQQGPLPDTLSH